MKLINSSVEILHQESGLEGIYKQIELAGRTCYKSEGNITKDSAKDFVERMVKSGHTAMLEHGTVYLYSLNSYDALKHYKYNSYSSYQDIYSHKEVCQSDVDYYSHEYVTTNYRVLVENNWLDDLQYLCEPTEYHHNKRITVKFTTDQGVMRELTRHRRFSFAVESTRYCNYSKDKFDNEVTFIMPVLFTTGEYNMELGDYGTKGDPKRKNVAARYGTFEDFKTSLLDAECYYMKLIKDGLSAQHARQVLPLATKCDVIMTGFIPDWKHFFDLRYFEKTGKVHPDMKKLTTELYNLFKEEKYV